MSAFTKVCKEVEGIHQDVTSVEVELQLEVDHEGREGGEGERRSLERTKRKVEILNKAVRRLKEMKESQVDKFVIKARETDPDKVIYGPQMVQKVLEFATTFEELLDKALQLKEVVDAIWEKERSKEVAMEVEGQREEEKNKRKREEEEAEKLKQRQQEELEILRLEKERIEKEQQRRREEEERERQEQERERALVLEKQRIKEMERKREEEENARREELEAAKRKAAETMTLDGGIQLLRQGFSARPEDQRQLKEVLKTLHTLMSNIVAEPSDPKFRRIRKENREIQKDLLRFQGGFECLYGLGFREKRIPGSSETKDGEVIYILEEPPMEQIDQWLEWFEGLKRSFEFLQEQMQSR